MADASSYFAANPDVAAAFVQNSYGLTPEQFATTHYNLYGANEQRAAPAVSAAAPTTVTPATASYLEQIKAQLTPAQYQQLIAPLAYTANENFGGNVQDYQAQLLTRLDTSKVNLPKQLEFTPATTREISYQGENGLTAIKVPVEPQVKSPGVTPIGGEQLGDGGVAPVTGYRSTTPVTVNGVPVFAKYDTSGKLTGYEGDSQTTTWLNGDKRLIGNWDASGNAAPITSTSQTGMFNTGLHWNDLRDTLEAAAVVAGNYFLPGSSLLTSKLVTEGAQEQLGSDLGRVANAAAGFTGGSAGNTANYGKIGDAAGITGPATTPVVTPTGAEGSAASSAASAASPSVSAETMQLANATSDPIATLNALQGYTYADLNYLSGLQGMTPEILARATANNALLTPIPREVIPAGSSTVTPVTATPASGTGILSSLTNLTPAQAANLAKAGISLGGLLGGAAAVGGVVGGAGGSGGMLTQQDRSGISSGSAQYSPEYYQSVQAKYNQMMPQQPRDVTTDLKSWYETKYAPTAVPALTAPTAQKVI